MAKGSDNPFPSILIVEGTTPTSPASGDQRLYIDSSNHHLTRVNSSGTTTDIEAGSSGAMTRISQSILGAAGTFSFTSIPGSYTDLLLTFTVRCDNAANQNIAVEVNNDSAAHYDWQLLQAVDTATPVASEGVAATYFLAGLAPGTGVTAGAATSARLWIPNYAQTTFWKQFLCETFLPNSVGSGGFYNYSFKGEWRSTPAISRIDILPATGNFIAGSIATLWVIT